MKKFSFPLDRVLAWRRLELDREQANLQRILANRNAIAQREAAARTQRFEAERLLAANSYIDASLVTTLPAWQSTIKKTIAALGVELTAANQKVAAQQALFDEARRRVRLLERLREARVTTWKADLAREEENFAAEAFLARNSGKARRVAETK